MANSYISSITGANNDNYNTRINTLTNTINSNYDWLNTYKLRNRPEEGSENNYTDIIAAGYLTIQSPNIATNVTTGTSAVGDNGIRFTSYEPDMNRFGGVRPYSLTDTNKGIELWGYNDIYYNNTGTNNKIYLKFGIKDDGTVVITRNAEDAFTKGIFGYENLAGTSNISEVVTLNNSVVNSIDTFQMVKWGRVVQLGFHWKNKTAISRSTTGNITNITVGTINTGYRPKNDIAAVGADGAGACWYGVSTNGTIELGAVEGWSGAGSIDAGTTLCFHVCYVCA